MAEGSERQIGLHSRVPIALVIGISEEGFSLPNFPPVRAAAKLRNNTLESSFPDPPAIL